MESYISGTRLKECREQKQVSLGRIAKELSIPKSTISRWENGITGIKIDKLKLLSEYFNVNPGWLAGFNVPKEIESDEHKSLRQKINEYLIYFDYDQLKMLDVFINNFVNKKE